MAQPAYTYTWMKMTDGRFGVFIVHRDTAEWYRLIASFINEDRAADFSQVENDIADDTGSMDREEERPAPVKVLPPAPPSGITVERLTRTVTETVTAEREVCNAVPVGDGNVMRALCEAEGEGFGTGKPSGRKGIPYTPANRTGNPTKLKNADAVLAAWKRLANGSDEMPTWGPLANEAGVAVGSLGAALSALEDRGEIYRDDHGIRHLGSKPIAIAAPAEESSAIVADIEDAPTPTSDAARPFKPPAYSKGGDRRSADWKQKAMPEGEGPADKLLAVLKRHGRLPLWNVMSEESGVPQSMIGQGLRVLEKRGELERDRTGALWLPGTMPPGRARPVQAITGGVPAADKNKLMAGR